jgi:heme/copper-type cytochrome/quinol oxidase subunit 3
VIYSKGHNSGKTFQSTPKENVFGNFHVVVVIILVKQIKFELQSRSQKGSFESQYDKIGKKKVIPIKTFWHFLDA